MVPNIVKKIRKFIGLGVLLASSFLCAVSGNGAASPWRNCIVARVDKNVISHQDVMEYLSIHFFLTKSVDFSKLFHFSNNLKYK